MKKGHLEAICRKTGETFHKPMDCKLQTGQLFIHLCVIGIMSKHTLKHGCVLPNSGFSVYGVLTFYDKITYTCEIFLG